MKKKILIITINDNTNYGNRLQNYAMSRLLKVYSDSVTIELHVGGVSLINDLAIFFIKKIKDFIKYILFVLRRNSLSLESQRYVNCIQFTKKLVPNNFIFVSEYVKFHWRRIRRVDHVVIGSDQVWNYRWLSHGDLALRLGSFVPDNIPMISYAASFGVSEISNDAKRVFQKYLSRLKEISVREECGRVLIKDMTGLDAAVVLDPTLMLEAEQWKDITQRFVSDNDCYVLTYFLGKPCEMQERTIQEYAKMNDCRVRRILDPRDEETYVAGPQDFVELFSKAKYVFTDSYHACCFSILFHKQFTVFNRAGMEGSANMNSRMETLFHLLNLDTVVMDRGIAPEIDYVQVDQLLERHRAESRSWLDMAMGV